MLCYIYNDIAVALHHHYNWNILPMTLSNLFYNLFDSINPATDSQNSTRLQVRHSIQSCSSEVIKIPQNHYNCSISTLLPSLAKFSFDTITTASNIVIQRLPKRFRHLSTVFKQRLKDIFASNDTAGDFFNRRSTQTLHQYLITAEHSRHHLPKSFIVTYYEYLFNHASEVLSSHNGIAVLLRMMK